MPYSKAAVSICVVIAALAFLGADRPKANNDLKASATDLARVGQDAIFYMSNEQGRFTIRLYSKKRKMQVLALSQKYNSLHERRWEMEELLQEAGEDRDALRVNISAIQQQQQELLNQANNIDLSKPTFQRVSRVGEDFIALERDNLTTVILKRNIHVLYLEEADEN